MSALFGGSRNQGQVAPAYTGLQLQTSSGIVCIPLMWGKARGAPNVIWYGDFTSTPQHGGGKGAGPVVGYDYHASLLMALCQGPISGIGMVWANSGNAVSIADTGFTLVSLGDTPQAPWSVLSANHPADAFSYNGTALVGAANYDLGGSPYAPSVSFELLGPRLGSQVGGDGDADPALIIEDFLTHPEWGVGIPMAVIDGLLSTPAATGAGDNAYQTYCRAMGFGMSPFLQNQEQALSILDRWTKLTNTAVYWSGYALKFVPYGDETVSANGVTYLPDLTPAYTLGDSDYVQQKNQDPVQISRVDPADAYNYVRIEVNDRSNWYAASPVALKDDPLATKYGVRPDNAVTASEVCVPAMAAIMVQLMLQRAAYIRNTYKFELPARFCLLEPMDVLAGVDAVLAPFSCRITSFEESDSGTFKITAEELTGGLSSAAGFTPQPVTNNPQNQLVAPGPVNPPVIVYPPSTLTNGVAEVWLLASGGTAGVADPNWGGYNVYLSTDGGASYSPAPIGQKLGAGRQGMLTAGLAAYGGANPDTGHTLSVSLAESGGALVSGSASDAANAVTLAYCDGELLSYQTASMTGANAFDLGTLYRGLYGTSPASHLTGTAFARLDDQVFRLQLPAGYIGQSLFVKLQSVNIFGLQPEDLSTVTAYALTPAGTGFGGGSGGVPVTPGSPGAGAGVGAVALSWSANPASDNIIAYELWRAPGLSASFGSAALIWSGSALGYTDSGLPSSAPYTYFLRAVNVVGPSLPSTGTNATTSAASFGPSGTATAVGGIGPLMPGYLYSASGAKITPADCSAGVDAFANVFVVGTYLTGATVTYLFPGQLIAGFSGLVPGATYWLGVAGALSLTPPAAGAGNGSQIMGTADETGTALFFNPGQIEGI